MLARYRFHPTAFILPPWEQIYCGDIERDQTFDEAVALHGAIRDWYIECGYNLVEVPRDSVEDRCEFVLRTLKGKE
jgi:predicted ATPase